MSPMYSLIMPIIENKIPKSKRMKPIRVPKPAKGTPQKKKRREKATRSIAEIKEIDRPVTVIIRKGMYECAKMPLNARSRTFNEWAFDSPPKRGGLSCTIPKDLYPAHANKPLTKRFRSCI